jgi:sulfate transport system ATP-binding protein/LacI family transcriptional regulator/LacI family repressor for deo operon, udp, cdd, tsx, nupC, and nupG
MSIKKIAEITGFSVATVARVLSDPDHKCAVAGTREKILQVARDMNYVPNESAKNLRKGNQSKRDIFYINVLVTRELSEHSDPFFEELIRLVEIEIRKNNCILSSLWQRADFSNEKYCMSENMEQIVNGMYRRNEQKSDGLIIIGKCSSRVLKVLKKHERNIVSINRNSTNYAVDEVLCDGKKIALTAIEYLAKQGHTQIGYVGDCHNETRFEGYQMAQMNFRLKSDIDYIFDTLPTEENGYKAMEYFLKQSSPPTAIYCANDILAIGMLKCLNKRRSKYYMPSIISSDDITEAQYTQPMLTTVSLPKKEMARFALILLLDRIQGGHQIVSKLEMEGTLVVRDSCRSLSEMYPSEYYI